MKYRLRVLAVTCSAAGLLAAVPAPAMASQNDRSAFGRMAAICAQEHLGKRANAPTVTCVCDGTTMTFANFGAMVRHMKEASCTMCC